MLNKRENIDEEKDCAQMLGQSLKEYRRDVKNTQIPEKEKNIKYNFDNSILEKMGLSEKQLKKSNYNCD